MTKALELYTAEISVTSKHDAKKAAFKIQKLDILSCCTKVNSKWKKIINIRYEALKTQEKYFLSY